MKGYSQLFGCIIVWGLLGFPLTGLADTQEVVVTLNGTNRSDDNNATTINVNLINGGDTFGPSGAQYKIEVIESADDPRTTGDDTSDDHLRLHNLKIIALHDNVSGSITFTARYDAGPSGTDNPPPDARPYLDHGILATFWRPSFWGPYSPAGNSATIDSDFIYDPGGPNETTFSIDSHSETFTWQDNTFWDVTSPKLRLNMGNVDRKLTAVFTFTMNQKDDYILVENNGGMFLRNSANGGQVQPSEDDVAIENIWVKFSYWDLKVPRSPYPRRWSPPKFK